jgi:alpha-ketoglutarate-dependent taurine dioxygenase
MADPTDYPFVLSGDLPLTARAKPGREDVSGLCAWLQANPIWVQEHLTTHGALLLRGFDVQVAEDFEAIARSVDPELKNEYLGTSPRDGITDYVFSASELPDFYPIPQHCEMSFCADPPRRVFFSCLEAPAPDSGETPLCDFRAVWRDLDPDVRSRFVEGGIRIIRNYSGPGHGEHDDPLRLKRWDEMFLTTDRAEVEAQCAAQGFEVTWLEDDGLRLVSTQPVYRDHPVTGERVWHNHVTTFHLGTAAAEYARIAAFRPSERNRNLQKLAVALEASLREKSALEQSMHCTHLDGREIRDEDMDAVRDAVWRNLVVTPWKRGDVVAIDNHSVSHGRLPYEGPRQVAVCWA